MSESMEVTASSSISILSQTMTENIADLAAALSLAQGKMQSVSKSSINPFFKSKYADLSAIWDSIREPLTSSGLSIVQLIIPGLDVAMIDTYLFHKSGQWIKSRISLKPKEITPQGLGSAYTYGRRYALSAILGVSSEEDDDGNAASKTDKPKEAKTPVKQPEATTDAWAGNMIIRENIAQGILKSYTEGKTITAKKPKTDFVIQSFDKTQEMTISIWGHDKGNGTNPGDKVQFNGVTSRQFEANTYWNAESIQPIIESDGAK